MYTSQPDTATTTSSYAESTKYVADILSSMANGGLENNTSSYVPNFLVSSGTGLTPTLTPTTLATIEQSFMELQNGQQSGANNGGRDPVTQSGFVPPVVDPGHSADVSQDSHSSDYSDSSEWEPKPKRGRMIVDPRNPDLIITSTGTINAAPQRKYTRRNKDEKLPPEEEERRRVRRERNKVAAAKCRQRRVDHTNELIEETEKLEAEQSQLENEIQNLQAERDQLEFILQAHQPVCKVEAKPKFKAERTLTPPPSCHRNGSVTGHAPQMNQPHLYGQQASAMPENLSMSGSNQPAVVRNSTPTPPSPSSLHMNSQPPQNPVTHVQSLDTPTAPAPGSLVSSSRPNSLPLIKRDRARMLSVTSATGVSINTPTSGVSITPSSLFCPGLDSMVDGSTGLTPITGMSCSSQVNKNGTTETTNESGSSPTLISL